MTDSEGVGRSDSPLSAELGLQHSGIRIAPRRNEGDATECEVDDRGSADLIPCATCASCPCLLQLPTPAGVVGPCDQSRVLRVSTVSLRKAKAASTEGKVEHAGP